MTSETELLLTRGLPKWPGLLVVGEPVTLEQAEEIIIRTASLHFSSNDKAFLRDLYKAADIELEADYPWPEWKSMQAAESKYKVLPLDYLHNSQIVSSYIGGPHGWCDWEGHIGCNNYNIGKWPSVENVFNEWSLIAAAFSFLKLKSQLFNGETSENENGELQPVVQFNINEGVVELVTPEAVGAAVAPDFEAFTRKLFAPGGERGCTIAKFKHALATTLKAVTK
jgi:hypothetical protein